MPSEDEDRAAVVAGLASERTNFVTFVRGRVGGPAMAEDIVQAAFTRALERIGTLRDLEAARAWFYRCLRNAITDHHRRAAAAGRRLAAVARETETAMTHEFGEFAVNASAGHPAHATACACIGEAVDRLGPNYRHAIRRVHGEGLALDAFASEAGITRGNAAVRLHRARKALHAEVQSSCGRCAEAGCRDCTCARA